MVPDYGHLRIKDFKDYSPRTPSAPREKKASGSTPTPHVAEEDPAACLLCHGQSPFSYYIIGPGQVYRAQL